MHRGCPPVRDGLPPVYEVRTTGGSMVRRANFDKALELVKRHSGGDLGRWVLQAPPSSIGPSRVDQRSLSAPLQQIRRGRNRVVRRRLAE